MSSTATDPVTGTLLRADLEPRLLETLARGGSCGLFMFDVDFFKTVNDVYGHQRGDEILRQLADRVDRVLRSRDRLFRYGGDEFVVLLPDTDWQTAVQVALRVVEEVRSDQFDGDPPLELSISLGVAVYPDDGTQVGTLLAAADRRNYLAKRRGRGIAVADDAEAPATAATADSRLWERDIALSGTQEFLTRLAADKRGALRIDGMPGAGRSRFLREVGKMAALRGFGVVRAGQPLDPGSGPNVLVLADVADASHVAPTVAALLFGDHRPEVLGVAYAATDGPVTTELPLLGTVELTPWSPGTLRIWLRSALQGEPSPALHAYIAARSGGLPARASAALDQLRRQDGLVATSDGWTLAPALQRPARRARRLPATLTGLVGRESDQARVEQLLADGRLVTLAGTGGIGKTRLSLAVANAVARRYTEGAVFVPLAEITDAELVVAAVAEKLEVAEVPGQMLLDSLLDRLADASVLLVMDNFEQVMTAAWVIAEILATAPEVHVLVTSRQPLSIYGEQVHRLRPLPLPNLAELPSGPAGVARAVRESPAVVLFEQRARAVNGEFELTPQTLPAVVELCRRLDGLPLAIELAAARADSDSPETLLRRISGHLDSFGPGPRDRPVRQQTVRGAIEWSYTLLEPAEQRLFVTLAVFVGGFSVDAVQAVYGGPEVVERLGTLASKSLLIVEQDTSRYQMLETIRAFAVEQLTDEPDRDATYRRHAAFHVELAEQSTHGMTGPLQAQWAERLEREYGNLRAAFTWAMANGDVDSAARISLGLWRYWRNGSHIREGREWLEHVLNAASPIPAPTRTGLLYAASILAATLADHAAAEAFGEESLGLAEHTGDRQATAEARNALGVAAMSAGAYDRAAEHFRHSLVIWRELDRSQGTAMALGNLTKLALRLGDLAAADEYVNQCLALERATGNTRGILLSLECLGQVRLAQGDLPAARAALNESLTLSRSIGDVLGEGTALHHLGLVAGAAGDRPEALRLLIAALARWHRLGDPEELAVCLDSLAGHLADTRPQLALRVLSAVDKVRERHRLPVPPHLAERRSAALADARARLGTAAFQAALVAGADVLLDTVIEEVLELAP
jgi:diguanylate cyclase (GGDEF)-like protein